MPTAPGRYLHVLEHVNLICSDAGPGQSPGVSTLLQLSELKLPAMEENFVDHRAGGAPIGIEVDTQLNRLECTFTLAGFQYEVAKLLRPSNRLQRMFTGYGLIRDRASGQKMQARAIMWGQLSRVNPTAFRKGDLLHHEYSIRSIMHYELHVQHEVGGQPDELFRWDFFENSLRIGGDDTMAQDNLILGFGAIGPTGDTANVPPPGQDAGTGAGVV